MTTPLWPDWLEDVLWAKSAEKGAEGKPESLARHTWYVLEQLAQSIHSRPRLPETLGFPGLWNSLFWACFLHDFGKAARGFQERLRGGERWPHRHEVLSLAFLDWIADALSEEESYWSAAAIVSHHREAKEIIEWYMDPSDQADEPLIKLVAEISEEVLAGLWRWLKECTPSWVEALGIEGAGIPMPALPSSAEAIRSVQKEGAWRIRHWLQAYRRWLRTLNRSEQRSLIIGTLALRGHLVSADHMASAHVGKAPLSQLEHPASLLARLQIAESSLYEHQEACIRTKGSAVLIAPTGSGKTESALLWACAQADDTPSVPRLFYTLPHQASMNAMYDRLNEKAFPGQVGLEHSRSVLALYRRFLDEDYTPRQAARAARWSKNLAQLNYFPVRVLSPYQILKAPFRLKGYEALMSDFFDAAFILDEVHAYEADRLAMILGTVKYLRQNFGARFFIMSATLPGILRDRLDNALGEYTLIQPPPELFARFRRHKLHLMEGDLLADRWMSYIAQVAAKGESVLVCCNTVKRTQQAYKQLQGRLQGQIPIILLHSRFNGRDRLEKEKVIRAATGSKSSKRQPVVLVATQVVEVSLDIDLDVIYTDPAPLEALIQRFGRINRQRRLKDGASVCVFTNPADGQGVYEDALVTAALKVLNKNANRMIDEERVTEWLDEIYQGQIADNWSRTYREAYEEFEAILRSLRAFNSDDLLEEKFYQAFDSIEVLPVNLEPEYLQLLEEDELLNAMQLLVPLRWRQFCRLRKEGKVHDRPRPDRPWVIEAVYDSEFGLAL